MTLVGPNPDRSRTRQVGNVHVDMGPQPKYTAAECVPCMLARMGYRIVPTRQIAGLIRARERAA